MRSIKLVHRSRTVALLTAFAVLSTVPVVLLGMVARPGAADEHPPPDHPHMLLLDYEIGFIGGVPHLVGLRKCVDVADSQALPLHVHHDHLHTGQAGDALSATGRIAVVPASVSGALPWSNCAEFTALIPIPVG